MESENEDENDNVICSLTFIENISLEQAYEAMQVAKAVPTPDGWKNQISCIFTYDYDNTSFLSIDFYLLGMQGQTIDDWLDRVDDEGNDEWSFKTALENIPYREGGVVWMNT